MHHIQMLFWKLLTIEQLTKTDFVKEKSSDLTKRFQPTEQRHTLVRAKVRLVSVQSDSYLKDP